ncbi:septum formation family protein [Mycobacterium sp. CVI_P3]|uniref:Septum formation family protein n=1 Tax=Mycobacterium pinniadriaticum TaxID=2994102 RepID=A0ABT3SK13_9MYCO|nr:septum formation family protein [Mycobacterium pinniadriaticum]MCX2933487.1 septum formation family protein [Mycobacterium pinniadriaticum]MCX2939874.1 septum formation family protein [Mycobacterium pinniadriaticum]
MDAMLQLSEREDVTPELPESGAPRRAFLRTFQATSTRRVLLLTALGGLLIAGVATALPIGLDNGLAGSDPLLGAKGSAAFASAKAGSCLNWPDKNPDSARIVDCKDEHRFEVAESVDMRAYPGTEYGPDAAPPTAARIQQISLEQCQPAVERYLGDKFDPNSKFTISMLWSGDKAWKQDGERRMLCGLQLPGADNQQIAFKGRVAEIDQSKVWPAGTCLGIDPATNQPTDVPVDCGAPHAMEVTGTVNLAEKFPGALPSDADQDAFIKDACTRMTDAYLAPLQLRSTTLTLIYSTISLPSWTAGSHQVACSIGATLGNGGWATLINPAKGPLLINGMPPVPPPDIPQERLNLPSIPLLPAVPTTTYSPPATGSTQNQQQQTQHLPQQSTAPTTQSQAPPTSDSAPPPEGNILNGQFVPAQPVPPPPADAPPPPVDLPPMDGPPPPAGPPPGPADVVPPPA